MDIYKKMLGKRLSSVLTAGNMLDLGFGDTIDWVSRRGITQKKSEIALHAQAPWRFLQNDIVQIAHNDIYYDEDGNFFEYDYSTSIFKTFVNTGFFSKALFKIEDVQDSEFGDLKIYFNEGLVLEVFANSRTKTEYWRLIDFITGEHLVVFDDLL